MIKNCFLTLCKQGDIDKVKYLINNSIDIECQDENGDTGFILACMNNQLEIIRLLLEFNVNIEHQNVLNTTGFSHCL